MRSASRVIIGALFASLVLAGAFASPASAKKPGTVKRVQVTAASTSSLTLTWNKVGGATKHEIFFSTSYSMKKAKKRKAGKTNSFRVAGLSRNKLYCFQVRALRGKSVGKKSQRTCKPTVRTQGATTGTNVRVVTYNVCSGKCSSGSKYWQKGVDYLYAAKPDVIGMQEAGNPWMAGKLVATGDYAIAAEESQRIILYKKSAFESVLNAPVQEWCGEHEMLDEQGNPTGEYVQDYCDVQYPRAGELTLGHSEYAAWAELKPKNSTKSFIVTSVHLKSGKGSSTKQKRYYAGLRESETNMLISETARINPQRLPVVHVGDFNSNKKRGSYDSVAKVMNKSPNYYFDGYDLAATLRNPNWNSSLDSKGNPVYAVQWGDHVDHIWVKPTVGVRKWQKLGSLSKPYASDHFPVLVDLIIPNS